jgi:pyruvate formate lyase activating enzyme
MVRVGLQKTTLLDFPGEVAATVFTPGCNLRCPYCHNPDLVTPPFPKDLITLEELDDFLEKRSTVLGGVCITGGEPLLHDEIKVLIGMIRSHGLKIKIDTNGTFPEKLPLLTEEKTRADYIAMDIKTSPGKYGLVIDRESPHSRRGIEQSVRESISWIKASGIDHEFRTTFVPTIVGADDVKELLPLLTGARRYIITNFRSGVTLDPNFLDKSPYPSSVLEDICGMVNDSGIPCEVR